MDIIADKSTKQQENLTKLPFESEMKYLDRLNNLNEESINCLLDLLAAMGDVCVQCVVEAKPGEAGAMPTQDGKYIKVTRVPVREVLNQIPSSEKRLSLIKHVCAQIIADICNNLPEEDRSVFLDAMRKYAVGVSKANNAIKLLKKYYKNIEDIARDFAEKLKKIESVIKAGDKYRLKEILNRILGDLNNMKLKIPHEYKRVVYFEIKYLEDLIKNIENESSIDSATIRTIWDTFIKDVYKVLSEEYDKQRIVVEEALSIVKSAAEKIEGLEQKYRSYVKDLSVYCQQFESIDDPLVKAEAEIVREDLEKYNLITTGLSAIKEFSKKRLEDIRSQTVPHYNIKTCQSETTTDIMTKIHSTPIPISAGWTIYDPVKQDFIFKPQCEVSIREWINKRNPLSYWLAICVTNNSDQPINGFEVEFEVSSLLEVRNVYVEGFEGEIPFNMERGSRIGTSRYIITVPEELGISIPRGGSKRIYIDIHSKVCGQRFTIENGRIKTENSEAKLNDLDFWYSCELLNIYEQHELASTPEARKLIEYELSTKFKKKNFNENTIREVIKCCNNILELVDEGVKTAMKYVNNLIILKNLAGDTEFYKRLYKGLKKLFADKVSEVITLDQLMENPDYEVQLSEDVLIEIRKAIIDAIKHL